MSSEAGGTIDRTRATPPQRILLVSADMGEGHNATARAVEQAARGLWPGCETRWLDTLDVMGAGVGPVFRRIYVVNVQSTPALYEFFYSSLWRYRWFAAASKRFVGSWSGRRLARHIAAYDPDVIVSTYPLGSAGLEWLRRHRGLDVPVSAWISDFAPHPFWVYRDLDLHYVMHPVSVHPAQLAEPGARVEVCAPPVVDAFGPGDRRAARASLGLEPDAFVVLLSCGSFGFGTVERAVDALLAAGPGVQIVAACGRNETLRARLAARGQPAERLLALGWTDAMPSFTVAADAVVTNAGGATALEAVACGRAVLMFEPIAAHGRANAELMATSGLAVLCRTAGELAETVAGLRDDPGRLAELEARAHAHVASYHLPDDVARAARRAGPADPAPIADPVRPEDAFFLHVETPEVTQQVGGVALLETGDSESIDHVLTEAERRLSMLPNLQRRLVAGPDGRHRWVAHQPADLKAHIRERWLGAPGEHSNFADLIDDFFSTPVARDGAPWELQFVHGLDGQRSAIIVKLHHSLGDGFAVVGALSGMLDSAAGRRGARPAPRPGPRRRRVQLRERTRLSGRVVRGLWRLARAGTAPPSSIDGPMTGPARRYIPVELPADEVRRTAKALHVRTSELLLAVVADALHRLLEKRGEDTTGVELRTMVPRTARTAATRGAEGNWTSALRMDVPVGPMGPRWRLDEVRSRMRRLLDSGQPEATRMIMAGMGLLPPRAHRWAARQVYRDRWFNLIVSILPGPRRKQSFAGFPLASVFPVLPLAQGVGLAIGVMPWGEQVGFGITADAELVPDVDVLAEAVRDAFADFRQPE